MTAFTSEQEARLRAIIREEIDADATLRLIWEGADADRAALDQARNRRILDKLRSGCSVLEAISDD